MSPSLLVTMHGVAFFALGHASPLQLQTDGNDAPLRSHRHVILPPTRGSTATVSDRANLFLFATRTPVNPALVIHRNVILYYGVTPLLGLFAGPLAE